MTSAFAAPPSWPVESASTSISTPASRKDTIESETEDEEVRLACVGGFNGIDESDMNSTDQTTMYDSDEDEEETEFDKCDEASIPRFVASRIPFQSSIPVLCPKAKKRLSPHTEEDEETCSSESENSQGESRSLGTPTLMNESTACNGSDEDHDADDESSLQDSVEGEIDMADISYHSDADDLCCSENAEQEIDVDAPDFELTNIIEALGDALECAYDESASLSGMQMIGVMEDRESVFAGAPTCKRNLSSNALNVDDGDGQNSANCKRRKSDDWKESCLVGTTLLKSLSYDRPSLHDVMVSAHSLRKFRSSPDISSGDEDLDQYLVEELDCHHTTEAGNREETPVPLLTPPGSPLTVEVNGDTTTVCEWPSNLIVESAIQAANELRPLSPSSLENFEVVEQNRVSVASKCVLDSTDLSPLLQVCLNVGTV